MEKQKLPNGVASIVLSIFGYLCCCAGIGIIPAGIGLFLALKSEKIYKENPDLYDNYSQIKTGKILSIIALVICLLFIIGILFIVAAGDFDMVIEEFMREYNKALEAQ